MAYESMAVHTPDARPLPSITDGHLITRQADGNIVVEGLDVIGGRIPREGDFDENLAEFMDVGERRNLAMRMVEFARVDKESRKDWERREKVAMEMLGITDRGQTDQESDTEDGHDVKHPALMEATARFQANAITELFPPTGPLETKIIGKQTPAKLQRAKRIRTFGNHYLTDIDKGYFTDTDRMMMYLPMGGSAFRKASQDYTTGLPRLRYVKATNFIAPYAGNDLPSMPRYAHEFTMTGEDIDTAQRIGMFNDIYLPRPSVNQEKPDKAADRSDYVTPIVHEDDRLYQLYEYHIDLILDDDPHGAGAEDLADNDTGSRPYIAIVDVENNELLMLRRNWKEVDAKHVKRIWFTHHQFLPGLGFYGWGYPHVIGSLGKAASGAVNALLDAAIAANYQGGFCTKEGRVTGELRLEHGVWKAIDATAEDLAKSFYTPPFKEPSPALFQLLGALVESAQRFAGTTDAAVGDGNNTGPVGTTVALIEQAQKPLTAIHKRLHQSMSLELQMLAELIEDFMPDRYDYTLGDGQETLLKSDFAPGVQIICVTDPNISSDTQRIMRGQALIQLQRESPNLYPPAKQAEAHRRMLVALKIPNIDAVGPEVAQPKYLDAVSENMLIFQGHPVTVFPQQDDAAHIQIHQDGLQRALAMGFPPKVLAIIEASMQAHLMQHYANAYEKRMLSEAGVPPNFGPDGMPASIDPRIEQQITARVVSVIARLPHPTPKPGTPSAEAQEAQQKLQQLAEKHQQELTQQQQSWSADEARKQQAFENEERRKDEALANQEARIDTTAATDLIRTQHQHGQDLVHADQSHGQDLTHAAQSQNQDLAQGAASHAQQLDQQTDKHVTTMAQGDEKHEQQLTHKELDHGQKLAHTENAAVQKGEHAQASHEQGLAHSAEDHEQASEQSEATHEQGLLQAEKEAQAAASVEAEADAHTGVK